MRILSLIACMCLSLSAWAQDLVTVLQEKKSGQGEVTLHQDSRLNDLVRGGAVSTGAVTEGDKQVAKVAGFRVQVYAGNNSRQARSEASNIGDKVKELFPELPVYTHFINPRWLCQVGDFRSIEEADAVMRKLKETGEFKEMAIVRGIINIAY